jgi:2'-5' RNA ligase
VSDPEGILGAVFERLNEEMTVFGAKREHRRFAPHVTLARVRGRFDGRALEERIVRAGELWFGSLAVDAVTLFMSELERGEAPRYTALGHYGAAP